MTTITASFKIRRQFAPSHLLAGIAILLFGTITGCLPGADQDEVVVYAALDAEFSEAIFREFERETGIVVRAKFDVESVKTVGLTSALMAEAARPRCDVFWNNEILNTLRLDERGLLAAYRSPSASAYPKLFRSPRDTWHGFAARARVLLVNTQLVKESDRPTSILDLGRPKWRGRTGIARPLFGTTATHAACLFAQWGPARAKKFFRGLKSNQVQILAGNKQVAQAVAAGRLAFGLTDTDDAMIELEGGMPVAIVYPDRAASELGTLFIPNTLAIIKQGPHPEAARKLVDYVLSAKVEAKLAEGPSAQIPLNPRVKIRPRVETPRTVKAMPVDFQEAQGQWESAARFLREEFGN